MPPRAPFTRSPVVLIANSGTWLNQALDSMLEPLGYKVVSVGSGRELLDRAPATRPDVVLMDANLQDLDSVAVCRSRRIRRGDPPGAGPRVGRDRTPRPERVRGACPLDHPRWRGADGPTADAGARNRGAETLRVAAVAGPGGLRGRRRPARDAARTRPPPRARRRSTHPGARGGRR